jgi:excinuclease ABC subunit C
MDRALQERIARLPAQPGVYLMKDRAGRVIYVGKAVNLRERVRSYLSGGDPRAFVPLLDRVLGDVETILVANEKEALLLENELVRRHRPRFNLKLQDGKNFVYLRLDPRETYPRLEVTRRVQADGARYFGPYPLAHALRETLRVVNRYFQLRTCSDHDPASHKRRACLLCQIARFPAPSVYDIPPEAYRRHVDDAILFLEGKQTELLDALQRRMDEAAAEMRFEEAARLRDQLDAIAQTLAPQKIVATEPLDRDALGLARAGDRLAIYLLRVRQGRVTGGELFSFRGQAFPEAEALASFLNLYYARADAIPAEILLPAEVESGAALAELLSERKGSRVELRVPEQGAELELVQMSGDNARSGLEAGPAEDATDVLGRLERRLGLRRFPRRIECVDVSHFHGGALVGSLAAMTDGQLDKDRYRRYRITTVAVGDDYAALYEVASRRFKRGMAQGDLPDLLIVDGGKGQLASVQAAMRDLDVTGPDVAALAKRRPIGGEAAIEARRKTPERIFLPGRRDPIVLRQDSPELLLLARLRDEAHRFAIAYQRKVLRRERLRSELEEIPGVGPKLRQALLRKLGSVARLREAGFEELLAVNGVGPKLARRIHAFLHPNAQGRPSTGDVSPTRS